MDASDQARLNAQVTRDAKRTTLHVGVILLIAVAAAWLLGRFNPQAPIEWNKVLSGSGGALAAWGTYFMLHDSRASWTGERPDEVRRKTLFRNTFLAGALLSILGAIW